MTDLEATVLVGGGGMSAAWAAISAARRYAARATPRPDSGDGEG